MRDQGLPEPGSRLPTSPSGRTPRWVVGEALGLLVQQPGGAATASGVVRHELAHLVGLDHVDDDSQLLHLRTVRASPTMPPATSRAWPASGRGPASPSCGGPAGQRGSGARAA